MIINRLFSSEKKVKAKGKAMYKEKNLETQISLKKGNHNAMTIAQEKTH